MFFTETQRLSLLFFLSYPAAQVLPCPLSSPRRLSSTPCLPCARLSCVDILLYSTVFYSETFTAVSRADTKTSYYLGLWVLVPNNCSGWVRTATGETTAPCVLGCPPPALSNCLWPTGSSYTPFSPKHVWSLGQKWMGGLESTT